MKLLALTIVALLVIEDSINVLGQGQVLGGCSNGDLRLIFTERLTNLVTNSRTGVVQICVNGGQWRTICWRKLWTVHAANVVCRQLGYLDNGAIAGPTNVSESSVAPISIKCQGTEAQLVDCIRVGNGYTNCDRVQVVCLPAQCRQGEIRLVNGTNREGRVEVCRLGRWGTICGEGWRQEDAGLVCSQLGFPSEGATNATFGEGTGPIYHFDCIDSEDIFDCLPSNPICDHSKDVGVRCLAFQDVCIKPVEDRTSMLCKNNEPSTCSMTSNCLPPTITITQFNSIQPTESRSSICVASTITVIHSNSTQGQPSSCVAPTVTMKTMASSTKSFTVNQTSMDTTNTVVFQVITGILLVLLIAVIVGWILTCVVINTKNSKKSSRGDNQNILLSNVESSLQDQRQLNNPVYDLTTVQQCSPANYSSLGPAYELVEANKGVGHTYDVINRNQQRGRNVTRGRQISPQNTSTESTSADLSSHHDYHVLEQSKGDEDHHDYHVLEPTNENKQENNYHVLEQSSQVPHNVEEQDYHVLESNSSAAVRESGREGVIQARQVQRGGDGIDPDPQDYEIPTPTMKPRGADEDEEAYFRLKH